MGTLKFGWNIRLRSLFSAENLQYLCNGQGANTTKATTDDLQGVAYVLSISTEVNDLG